MNILDARKGLLVFVYVVRCNGLGLMLSLQGPDMSV